MMATPVDEALANRARFAVKLSAVQSKVHNIRKSERNSAQGYNYASTESILAMVRPILVECGLAVLMSTRAIELAIEQSEKGGQTNTDNTAHVSLDIALIDTDTGYSETQVFDGFGKDRGDKAVPKAYTMAAKYWARTAFMIDLQADAERDAARPAAPRQPSPPAPAPQPAPRQRPAILDTPAPGTPVQGRQDLATILELKTELRISDAKFSDTLGRDFGVEKIGELTPEQAAQFQARLETAKKNVTAKAA
jgi:hypothetical protein